MLFFKRTKLKIFICGYLVYVFQRRRHTLKLILPDLYYIHIIWTQTIIHIIYIQRLTKFMYTRNAQNFSLKNKTIVLQVQYCILKFLNTFNLKAKTFCGTNDIYPFVSDNHTFMYTNLFFGCLKYWVYFRFCKGMYV